MPSRRRLRTALASAAVLACACARQTERPNVVLVTFDGLRQDHLSLAGYSRRTSPTIDALARQGLYFPQIVPTSCSTKASLTSLLTALDYSSHQLVGHNEILTHAHETLAERFAAAGYATFGAVASPHVAAKLGYDQGFDEYVDFARRSSRYVTADLVVAGAAAWLAEHASSPDPFFVYLHFEEPHPPWIHRSEWSATAPKNGRRFFGQGCTYIPAEDEVLRLPDATRRDLIARYDGSVRFGDRELGRLVASLRERGELRRTIVAVSTDHGIELVDRSTATHGFCPYDEVVRGFLVLFDGRRALAPRSAATGRQGRIFDIGPTLLALAGVENTGTGDGVDLLAELPLVPEVATVSCYGSEVARSARWKLIDFDFASAARWFPEHRRPFDWRDGPRLFDLATDPGETTDVGDLRPEERARLLAVLDRRRRILAAGRSDRRELPPSERDQNEIERLRALGYIE